MKPRTLYDLVIEVAIVRPGPIQGDMVKVVSGFPHLVKARLEAQTAARRAIMARGPTWIGLVPVGYADGFRRDMTGTSVHVEGRPCRVVGAVSMDAFAVELDRELLVGTPVTLIGHGVLIEDHARAADTLNYELSTRIDSSPPRARRVVIDA